MLPKDDSFEKAGRYWDLETLYLDLASAKGRRLTPTEKLHLRGLLCNYSPAEIAQTLGKNVKGVETDLCATLYRYVKKLVGKNHAKVENWRNITEWLEDAGYRNIRSSQGSDQGSASTSLNDKFNITNIKFENNQIKIGVYLQITVPISSGILDEEALKRVIQNADMFGSDEADMFSSDESENQNNHHN
jgi:hypothetical protein